MADEWADFRVKSAPSAATDPWAEFRAPKVSATEDVAKSAGIGAIKGAIGTIGAAGDLRGLASSGIDYLADKAGVSPESVAQVKDVASRAASIFPTGKAFVNAPTSRDIQSKVEETTGEFYKPQTVAGKYAQTAGEFLPAAVGGPGGVLARSARVLVPATVSETAGQATEGSRAEPVARFLGALAGGGAVALASRPGSATRSIANQLPEGITEPMVVQADRLMQEAAGRGIQLAWPEALSQVAGRPVLTNMMRHLEASPQTEGQMGAFFAQRPQGVEGAVRQELGNIAPANVAPSTVGPAVGRAAEGTLEDVRGAINNAARPFYQSAETVLLDAPTMARVRALPGYEAARDAVRNDPQLNRYVANLPDESVGFLNEVKKQLDNAATHAAEPLNTQGRNMQRAAGFGQDATAVRDLASSVPTSTAYPTALAIESVGRERFLQPLLDGPLGKIAGRDTTTKNAIDALFPRNPLPNSHQEITTTVSALAHRNERSARDLVRAHAESTFNEAARDLQTGPNQANGAKFRAALVGNPQQHANLQAAVEALPNGQQRWEGFNRLLDVLEATGTRQGIGSRTAYNAEINKAQGAGGVIRDAGRIAANPTRLLQPIADKYDQWKLGRNLGQLATILTDPTSANMLRAIARAPVDSTQAVSLAARLVTYANASRAKPVEQRNQN